VSPTERPITPGPSPVTAEDHSLAAALVTEAGRLLTELRVDLQAQGADEKTLKDQGDQNAHQLLMQRLVDARPHDAILSEEGQDDLRRLDFERVWIVDPLDGTREFGEGRADWAVHVALAVNGVPIAGAVALPDRDLTLSTAHPPTLAAAAPDTPRVIVSRSRPPQIALQIAEGLGGSLVEMGSAGAKAMAVVLGDAECYPHAGGQYEWDSCAPVAVAAAAGLHTSRLDGSQLTYNNEDPYLPDLLICRRELAARTMGLISRFGVS